MAIFFKPRSCQQLAKQLVLAFNLNRPCMSSEICKRPSYYQTLCHSHYRRITTGTRSDNSENSKKISDDPELQELLKQIHADFTSEDKGKDSEDIKHKDNQSDGYGKENSKKERVDQDQAQETSKNPWSQAVKLQYEHFHAAPTQIIYDYDEERQRLEEGLDVIEEEEVIEQIVSLERGETGVFDIEEFVDLLREQNVKDIITIQVPPELGYVDFMVIASGKSSKHHKAVSEVIRRIHKKKKSKKDPGLIIEGKQTNWIAMDLGNIAFHLMDSSTRDEYDLESLWSVGSSHDEKCFDYVQEEKDILKKLLDPLADLTPKKLSEHQASLQE
ncbi:ribosomal silencing factor RsfS-like protein, 312 [Oratosquilla oratoria]|uniref:ribosomal silencing factor RsfS-like protein, 312 n=1 Tax=Oratosquilla oratoria TaxID=337810 RepID=UPI003F76DCE1